MRKLGSSKRNRHAGASFGSVAAGFDDCGYPMVRNLNLPADFRSSRGQGSGTAIKPMRFAMTLPDGGIPTSHPSVVTTADFRLKPSPTVPAAPSNLPPQYEFCVQIGESGNFFRYRDPTHPLHGSAIEVLKCEPDEDGMLHCEVEMPGTGEFMESLICEDLASDKERVPGTCCVRILGEDTAQLVCPGSAYDLLLVGLVTVGAASGIQIASVSHPDLPGGGVRLPICEPIEEEPDERPCCIEESTGLIVCPEGVSIPLAGQRVPLEFLEFGTDEDGNRFARLLCGDISEIYLNDFAEDSVEHQMHRICDELGGYIFSVCSDDRRDDREDRMDEPPPRIPDICCYDAATGTLVCEGTEYHGLEVRVVSQEEVGGVQIVVVEGEGLDGGICIPLCAGGDEVVRIPPPVVDDETEEPTETPPPVPGPCCPQWEDMVSVSPKQTDCDKRWLDMLKKREAQSPCPGRRGRASRKEPRFPGLRGGRKTV